MFRGGANHPVNRKRDGLGLCCATRFVIGHSLFPRVTGPSLVLDVACQRVECTGPKVAVVMDPAFNRLQRPRLQGTEVHPSIDSAIDQAGVFEHLNMSRDRRQRHIERSGEFGHHGWAFSQSGEQRPPRSVRKRPENPVKLIFSRQASSVHP